MTTFNRASSMPPMINHPAPGTQTSDRYGNVIATRPAPVPETPASQPAPTCDKWGNIVSTPPGYVPPSAPIPGTHYVPNAAGVVDWK